MKANQEMMDGYLDGRDISCPEPSNNRTHSYRHGFRNGRNEIFNKAPRASVSTLIARADEAMILDMQ